MEKGIVISDSHHPFHDPVTIKLVKRFIKDWEPNFIESLGDDIDFYAISTFDKDPERITKLDIEISKTRKYYKELRECAPDADIEVEGGNHEDRLRRYIWKHAPALKNLDSLKLPELLGLNDQGISYRDYKVGREYKQIYFTHGSVISKHSGWTAKAHYEKYGGNGICGHSHRGGNYLISKRGDTSGWWENFCLCDLNPEYVDNPNWQQGFSLIYFLNDRFFIEQIPIVDHRFVVEGKYYYDDKKKVA